MSFSAARPNNIMMKKYVWMSHQLRNFNDVLSIVNWTNPMLLFKVFFWNLYLEFPFLPTLNHHHHPVARKCYFGE